MTTIWNMPRIELTDLSRLREQRPAALLTGKRSWQAVNTMLKFPVVVQAEPESADRRLFEFLSENLPKQVQVVYAVGAGLVCDAAKYIAWKRKLPAVPGADGVERRRLSRRRFRCVMAGRACTWSPARRSASSSTGMSSARRRRIFAAQGLLSLSVS
ncbi:MAG: hypothetical protein HND48_13080 [Chloroflexi bacterium]|nr:hypothetical protein [Chloroflexota bacterium]